jgi:hypothetical protein
MAFFFSELLVMASGYATSRPLMRHCLESMSWALLYVDDQSDSCSVLPNYLHVSIILQGHPYT